MDEMYYGYRAEDPTAPISTWVCTKELDYGSFVSKQVTREDGNEIFYMAPPYTFAFGYMFFSNPEDAENSRRAAIVKRYGDLKRHRASIGREIRALQEIINSWDIN